MSDCSQTDTDIIKSASLGFSVVADFIYESCHLNSVMNLTTECDL